MYWRMSVHEFRLHIGPDMYCDADAQALGNYHGIRYTIKMVNCFRFRWFSLVHIK